MYLLNYNLNSELKNYSDLKYARHVWKSLIGNHHRDPL